MKVSVAEAKNKLTELIKIAEEGETITICRHGEPVVDIVRTAMPKIGKPKLGTMKDRIVEIDPDWWKPMTTRKSTTFSKADTECAISSTL
jgi:prevent-host-death family protein